MEPYRIAIADDHAMFRSFLKKVLEENKDLAVVAEVSDGLELLKVLQETKPDFVILDISMPNLRGLEALDEIKAIRPATKILLLTMHRDIDFLHQALSAGANGYLLKEEGERELFMAVDLIRNGKPYISPLLSDDLAARWARLRQEEGRASFAEALTLREREVLKLIAEGKSNKEIAQMLFISVHTVERHRAHIMEKLKIKKIADLVRYAILKGYVGGESLSEEKERPIRGQTSTEK